MIPLARFVEEFEHTRPRHGGNVTVVARILGIAPLSVIQACRKAEKKGYKLSWINDIDWSYELDRKRANAS